MGLGVAVVPLVVLAGSPAVAQPVPSDLSEAVKAVAKTHRCDPLLPSSAAGRKGSTLLVATVTANGELSKAQVLRSSGDKDLDAAAIQCANHTVFPQAREAFGTAFDWMFQIDWRPNAPSFILTPDPKTGAVRDCLKNNEQLDPADSGTTALKYRILKDGSVGDVAVVVPSGNAHVDELSVRCVGRYRFFPAFQNGKPIEIDWQSEVSWRSVQG
jgi:TonB family protein